MFHAAGAGQSRQAVYPGLVDARLAFVMLAVVSGCRGETVGEAPGDGGAGGSGGVDWGGYEWTLVYDDAEAAAGSALHSIWGASADFVVAVGTDRQIVQFEGGEWSRLTKTAGAHLFGVWGRSSVDVAAVGLYSFAGKPAIFYRATQGWVVGGPFPDDMPIVTDVWGVGTQKYFTAQAGRIYQDDPINKPNQRYHLAVNTGGCPEGNPTSPQLNGIDGTGLDNVLVAGDDALLAHRDDTGWARFCALTPEVHYSAVTAIPGSTDFYVGSNFLGLVRWRGRGEVMTQIHEDRATPGADELYLHGLWAASAALVIGVGDGGRVLVYEGTKDGAREIPSPTTESLYGVWGADEATIYVTGKGSRIWRLRLP